MSQFLQNVKYTLVAAEWYPLGRPPAPKCFTDISSSCKTGDVFMLNSLALLWLLTVKCFEMFEALADEFW